MPRYSSSANPFPSCTCATRLSKRRHTSPQPNTPPLNTLVTRKKCPPLPKKDFTPSLKDLTPAINNFKDANSTPPPSLTSTAGKMLAGRSPVEVVLAIHDTRHLEDKLLAILTDRYPCEYHHIDEPPKTKLHDGGAHPPPLQGLLLQRPPTLVHGAPGSRYRLLHMEQLYLNCHHISVSRLLSIHQWDRLLTIYHPLLILYPYPNWTSLYACFPSSCPHQTERLVSSPYPLILTHPKILSYPLQTPHFSPHKFKNLLHK